MGNSLIPVTHTVLPLFYCSSMEEKGRGCDLLQVVAEMLLGFACHHQKHPTKSLLIMGFHTH